jgi:glutamate/tyrosine decarboxylase-like PLP-dependent enzyme
MLGMGRESLLKVPTLPGREAVDLRQLRHALENLDGAPAIVIGNAGTVNSVDFDDLRGLAALREEFPFWLHIDAAFGGFAAVSPTYQHYVAGLELADSITIDAHKWMNVPYDAAMSFSRREHRALQTAVFQNSAAYLTDVDENPDYFHLTPENSRRFRALPAWFGLMAYGKAGYQEIVERNCATAAQLSALIEESRHFRMVAPVRMNVICFTVKIPDQPDMAQIRALLRTLQANGRAFLTPSVYDGTPCIRAAFSNWRTTPADVEIVMEELENAFEMALSL